MRNLLEGERVRLTAVEEEDIPVIRTWFWNVEFLRHYDMIPGIPQSTGQIRNLIDGYHSSHDRLIFAVRLKENDRLIGIAGFEEIIWSNGTATAFIGIGDENHKGKGLGKEAFNLLLDFGFNELNFHKVQLNVLSYNTAAINMYESLGFVREGTYREFILRDGIRYDMYLYGMLKREYNREKEKKD